MIRSANTANRRCSVRVLREEWLSRAMDRIFVRRFFFLLMAQLARLSVGLADGASVNQAIDVLFGFAPRVALASLLGFVVSQYFNIGIYVGIKEKMRGKFLFLRSNVANVVAQLVDSSLFFTTAFFGILPMPLLVQSVVLGWLVKAAVGILAMPMFYWSGHFKKLEH